MDKPRCYPSQDRLRMIAAHGFAYPQEIMAMAEALLVKQPAARRSDPETSHAAARAASTRVTAGRRQVLECFSRHGQMTDEQLVWNMERMPGGITLKSESGIRTRRSELVKLGKIQDSGRRRLNAKGRRCVVWERVET